MTATVERACSWGGEPFVRSERGYLGLRYAQRRTTSAPQRLAPGRTAPHSTHEPNDRTAACPSGRDGQPTGSHPLGDRNDSQPTHQTHNHPTGPPADTRFGREAAGSPTLWSRRADADVLAPRARGS
ncbi:hypothetical protein GCM10012285_47280 [Streptomyces kronopolitis]|uniref:Uncharacterized protein n=1 Tax=Streptomyces kronopolitis TaxID=1612435 RepID=A0ABQ2JU12_9ACTN|nr:hypothetical protein GCM10012285_47280 [Streptomyces kronopolitis]